MKSGKGIGYKFIKISIFLIGLFETIISQNNEDITLNQNKKINENNAKDSLKQLPSEINLNHNYQDSSQIDLQITLSPNEYQLINLDTLLAQQGNQKDNYKFLDFKLLDYGKQQFSHEINHDHNKEIRQLKNENDYLCSSQTSTDDLVSFEKMNNFEKGQQFPKIEKTKIHLFISDTKIVFAEKQNNDYQTLEFPDYQFKSCSCFSYFSKDLPDQLIPYKYIIIDCDMNLQQYTQQTFLIIDITKVNTLNDIKKELIIPLAQPKDNICQERNLLTMVFTLNVPHKETQFKDLFIQSCLLTNKTDSNSYLFISEVTINSQGKLNIQQRVQVNTQEFPKNPLALSVDVQLNNRLFFFFESDQYSFIQIFELMYKNSKYVLESRNFKKLYGKDFSTAKFVSIFNKNPLEKKNYLMCTPTKSYNNLYILDVTIDTNMAYVSKKILIPEHIIEQTLVTRDFIVIKGCVNSKQQTINRCQDIPRDSSYEQFIAVFSLKENRYNVHYYEKFQTTSQLIIDGQTDNYVLNSIILRNYDTGEINSYTIRDNYLKLTSLDFSSPATRILQFTLNSTNLIQKLEVLPSTRRILINFAQTIQTLKLTDDGNKLFENKAIQRDDLYFTVSLENKVMGPQIEYLLIKEFHDNSKYNVTINNQLKYDLALDLKGKYFNQSYNVTLTHVTNANFNQIQIFTQFNTTKGIDMLYHICTLNKDKQNIPCQKQDFLLNYPYYVRSFKLYSTSIYTGLISKEKPYNVMNQILVAFFMNDKEQKAQEILIDQISAIEIIDQQYVGILRASAKQIIVLELHLNQAQIEQENGEVLYEKSIGWTKVAEIQIDINYAELIKVSLKLFTTRSIIFIHTHDNIIRVQGIYQKQGYSNQQLKFGMNNVSQYQLDQNSQCHFTVYSYPIVIIVCVDKKGYSTVSEYTLSSDKNLIKTRTYNSFQYKINQDFLRQSYTDKVFFYQRGYYIDADQRSQINTLLVYDPLEMSTNTLKSSSCISNKNFNVPFDIDSTYGSYMLFNTDTVGARNQVQIISIKNNPYLSFNIAPVSTVIDFNLTFYAISNYTQSSIFRKMQISTNMEQYMVVGKTLDKGWNRINKKERFISISIPQDIFKGPIRRMFLLNTTDLEIINNNKQKNQDNSEGQEEQTIHGEEMILKNKYYITLSQMMIPTKQSEELNYVNIQKHFGQIIGVAYFQPDDIFIFLMQKEIICMPAQDKDISLHVMNHIFVNRALSYDYSQCNLYHHQNWRLFFVLCSGVDTNELYRFTYTLTQKKNFNEFSNDKFNIDDFGKNMNYESDEDEGEQTSENNKWIFSIKEDKLKIETLDYGIIQTMILSENNKESFDILSMRVFFMTRVDKNYDETVIKVEQFMVSDTLFDMITIDANTLNRRSLYSIDISIKSFSAEIDQKEMYLIALLTKNEIIFVILSYSGIIYRSYIQNINPDEMIYETIDLQKVTYFRTNVPCLNIRYIIQYQKRDALYQQVDICSPPSNSHQQVTDNNTQDWIIVKYPVTIETYKHYKTCAQYSAKPIAYWGKQSIQNSSYQSYSEEDEKNQNFGNEDSPLYLARFCIFNDNEAQQSSIGQESSSKSFHLILYTNKIGDAQQTQTVIELPFFNSNPSTIFFFEKADEEKTIHILVTSYINLYIDYLIQNSYYVNIYFKYTQDYMLSRKTITIQGENDHFSNYSTLKYNVIDYMINDQSYEIPKMLYVKSILSLVLYILYAIPIITLILNKKKTKKKIVQQPIKEDISPIFNRNRETNQASFGEDARQSSTPDNNRFTYENHLSTPSMYRMNSNTDNDSESEN